MSVLRAGYELTGASFWYGDQSFPSEFEMIPKSPLANVSGQMLRHIRERSGRRNKAELLRWLQRRADENGELFRSEVPRSRNGIASLEAQLEVPSKAVGYWREYIGPELFDDLLAEARILFPFISPHIPHDKQHLLQPDLGHVTPRDQKGDEDGRDVDPT